MTFHIITIFPKIFESYFQYGVLRSAIRKDLVKIKIYDLRNYTNDKHRTVDDTIYGGGAGMLFKVEPVWKCVEDIRKKIKPKKKKIRVILFCARGKKYSQPDTRRLQKFDDIIFICGRYEGVDERIARHVADETISIGEYILTGGEIPAMILIDSISRTIEGVLGNEKSFLGESFSQKGYLEYPQYTKPANFRGWKVPNVLLSGDHGKIEKWRIEQSKRVNQSKKSKISNPNVK